MPLLLETLTVCNFKSCTDLEISLSSFTPMVGYNNAGKSNILSAIEWLIKGRLLAEDSYFDSNCEIRVEAEISGIDQAVVDALSQEHAERIRPYIVEERIRIRRVQPSGANKASDVKLEILNPENNEFRAPPTGIQNSTKALLPDVIHVGAMEDAAEDAAKSKSTTTIGKLLSVLCEGLRDAHHDEFNRHLGEICRQVSSDGDGRLQSLDAIDGSINQKISELFPGISLRLHFQVPTFEDIFKSGTVMIYEGDGGGRPLTSYGHGAQRSVQMALIRELAKVRQESESTSSTLLLIDEPELYLHPFAVEQVREALHSLAGNSYQVVFTTHSSQMITSDRAQHALLIRKDGAGRTYARARMRDAIKVVVPNSESQAAHLFALSQSSTVLFSEFVVITEGTTEIRLVPFLFQLIDGDTLGQKKISVVQVGSVESVDKSQRILHAMDIPSKAIVDLDYAFRGAIDAAHLQAEDHDIANLKRILAGLAESGQIKISAENGLPTGKDSPTTAAKAFSLLASLGDAKPFIDSIHAKLLTHGIWLWKKGAIEDHLGIEGKKEVHWARLKERVVSQGVDAACADPQSIRDLVAWVGQPYLNGQH